MMHSQWQRLKVEGEKIVTALRERDYQCYSQVDSLSWTIRKGQIFYRLVWLPSPMREWSLLPNNGTSQREKLLSYILRVVESVRGSGDLPDSPALDNLTDTSSNDRSDLLKAAAPSSRLGMPENYPWTLVQLLPNAQRYVVERFYNRIDAEDHQRFLGRFIPDGKFEVVFDVRAIVD